MFERAVLRDLARRLHEALPRRARERAAHTDAPHAERGQLRNRGVVRADQHVHGPRRELAHDRHDLFPRADARRIKTVRPCFRIRNETAYRLREIRPAHQKPFTAAGENDAAAAFVDGAARSANALDGELEIEQRLVRITARVLYRKTGYAGLRCKRDVVIDTLRLDREAAFEICVDGNVYAR